VPSNTPLLSKTVIKVGRGELYPTIQARVKQGGCHSGGSAGRIYKPLKIKGWVGYQEYRETLVRGPDSES